MALTKHRSYSIKHEFMSEICDLLVTACDIQDWMVIAINTLISKVYLYIKVLI